MTHFFSRLAPSRLAFTRLRPRGMSSTSEELVAKALREGSAGAAAIPGPSAATLEALAAAMQPQPVSLQMLSSTAQDRSLQIRLQQANFIRRELIARRVRILALLHTMPESLARREAVSQLAGVYWERLKSVMERPDAASEEDERGFLARQMKHNESIKTIGDAEEEQMCIRALDEMQLERGSDWWATHPEERVAVDRHLDAIFLARISLRFLLKHYIASETSKPGFVGIIERACSPVALCRALSASIRTKLQDQYGQVPSVEIVGDERHTFTYVPSHIEYVVGTLLKNSLVATLRRQHGEPQGIANIPPLVRHLQPPLPPVRVIVSAGEDVVQIKLADEAGGISRSSLINVWSYRRCADDL